MTYKLKLLTFINSRRILMLFAVVAFNPYAIAEINYELSGFGNIGYDISNKPYAYGQYIDNEGTFESNSLLAGQLDIQFTPQLSATFQAQLTPDENDDSGWEPKLSWAFLSYRPANDWLIRLGKIRVPGYLNSQNRDVGVTYDYTTIPAEFDAVSPTYDFIGLSINKTFSLEDGDLFLDAYYAQASLDWRDWIRNDVGTSYSAGSLYTPIKADVFGAALTYQDTDNIYVLGAHHLSIQNKNTNQSFLIDPVYVELYPGEGYYSTDESLGAKRTDEFQLYIINAGADINVGYGVRLAVEMAARHSPNVETGLNSYHGYVSLRKTIDNWTPYLFYSRMRSTSDAIADYQKFNNSEVNTLIPGASIINASQKTMADIYQVYDQYSIALGSSYALSPKSKLKAQVMVTHIGAGSNLFDSNLDSLSDTSVATFSIAYSFAF